MWETWKYRVHVPMLPIVALRGATGYSRHIPHCALFCPWKEGLPGSRPALRACPVSVVPSGSGRGVLRAGLGLRSAVYG